MGAHCVYGHLATFCYSAVVKLVNMLSACSRWVSEDHLERPLSYSGHKVGWRWQWQLLVTIFNWSQRRMMLVLRAPVTCWHNAAMEVMRQFSRRRKTVKCPPPIWKIVSLSKNAKKGLRFAIQCILHLERATIATLTASLCILQTENDSNAINYA